MFGTLTPHGPYAPPLFGLANTTRERTWWSCLGPYTSAVPCVARVVPASDGGRGEHVGIGRTTPAVPVEEGPGCPPRLVGLAGGLGALARPRSGHGRDPSSLPVVSNFPFGLVASLPFPSALDRSDCSLLRSIHPSPQLTLLPRRARLPPCPPSASRIYTRAPASPAHLCLPHTRSAPRPFHAAAATAVPHGRWLIGRNSDGGFGARSPCSESEGRRRGTGLSSVRRPGSSPRSGNPRSGLLCCQSFHLSAPSALIWSDSSY